MLSRRIPAPQQPPPPIPSQSPSAIPPYLQRAPQGSPPAHPGRALPSFQLPNPARPPRHVEIQLPIPPPTPPRNTDPHPAPSISSPAPGEQPQPRIIPEPVSDLDVNLVVVQRAGDAVRVGKPFTLGLRLSVAATIPRGRRRQVRFVVRHFLPWWVPAHTQSMSETL
jgi:hypothetical protein